MSRSKPRGQLVFVHHKKTGEIEVRRADEFSACSSTIYSPTSPSHLHYSNKHRSHVCRCSKSRRHKDSFPVASDSTHLTVSATRFLSRHGLESCSIAALGVSEDEEKAEWARKGIYVDTFHYATKQKDVVCQCTRPNNHGCGIVRNSEIMQLCAEFFDMNKNQMTCSKSQWRAHCMSLPVLGSPSNDSFKYDSRSTLELLRKPNDDPTSPRTAQHFDMRHLTNEPNDVPDIPEQVWQNARPAAWSDRRNTVTPISTPVGTPQTPRFPKAQVIAEVQESKPAPVKSPKRVTVETCWSDIQRDAARHDSKVLVDPPLSLRPTPHTDARANKTGKRNSNTNSPDSIWNTSPAASPKGLAISPTFSLPSRQRSNDSTMLPTGIEVPSTTLEELPIGKTPVEMEVPSIRSHSATLRELEGHGRQSPAEMPSKYPSTLRSITIQQSNSHTTQVPSKLSTLFGELHDALCLPNQEEFLLREVIPCSRNFPAPAGDCMFCNEPYDHRRELTFQIPGCGHFIHEHCLVTDFRGQDQAVGTCPVCNIALCKRDLADRIETDRTAIFGAQYTKLRHDVRVEYPQRGEAATLQSEEELAAAQLRLLKDYVNIHVEDVWRQWKANRAKPDWYGNVIQPVIQLFKGWSQPWQQSQYFSERDAFLKLIAWAELVRLVNVTRVQRQKSPGPDLVSPSLAELHRKFNWAKERYDKEKKTWKTNCHGVLKCEKVAHGVYDIAMRSHHGVA